MDEPGAMLAWPFADRRWPVRLGLMGLLWLVLNLTLVGIPIAGIALTGWMLTAADNLRSGRRELPAPGLHLARGWRLYLAQLCWLGALLAVVAVPLVAGFELRGPAGGLLVVLGESLLTLGTVALAGLTPALALLSDTGGLASAVWPGRLLELLRSRPRLSMGAALMSLLCLDIISPIGLLACGIGLAVSATYAYAVLASTIVSYDRQVRR